MGHRSHHWLLRVVEPPTVRVPLGKSFLLQTRVVFWRHTRWITMIWSQYVSNMSQMCITCVSHVCHMCVTYVSRLVCHDLRLSHSSCSLVRCMVPLDWAPYTGRYDPITPRSQDGFCVESWRLWHDGWKIAGEIVVTPRTLHITLSILAAHDAWQRPGVHSCSMLYSCIATSFPKAYHLCACYHQLKWSICFIWSDLLLVFPTE